MENLSLFDCNKMPLKIDKPIRLIELFAGIGSQAKALKRLGADFEHYRVCEFDKYAIKSYNAIHGTDFVTSDVTKITADDLGIVDTDKYCYIMTYSFPCQDLSLAGKGNGMAKGSGTRSGLLWEVERLLNECTELPQILLMENVTQVHGKKNKEHFDEWIRFLESKGYSNYWKDLNAKNFGIPQNRNRTFMVSILGEYVYEFPKEFPLELRLKDMLEDSVDEKFYLNDAMIERLNTTTYESGKFEKRVLQESGISRTLCARDYKDPKCVEVGSLIGGKWDKMHDVSRRVYSDDGISPTIHTCGGGNTEPKIIDPFICASRGRNPENPSDRTPGIPTEQKFEPNFSGCSNTLTTVQKDNYVVEPSKPRKDIKQADRYCEYCGAKLERKRFNGRLEDFKVFNNRKFCNRECMRKGFLKTGEGNQSYSTAHATARKINELILQKDSCELCGSTQNLDIHHIDGNWQNNNLDNLMCLCRSCHMSYECNKDKNELRVRKLTPRETWRLMGFDDIDFEKAAEVNSNSQLYKQAGNSIVVDVLCYIFGKML